MEIRAYYIMLFIIFFPSLFKLEEFEFAYH